MFFLVDLSRRGRKLRIRQQIEYMDDLSLQRCQPRRGLPAGSPFSLEKLGELRRSSVVRNGCEELSIVKKERRDVRIAKSRRIGKDGFEDGPAIRRRARNDPQYFTRRSLWSRASASSRRNVWTKFVCLG